MYNPLFEFTPDFTNVSPGNRYLEITRQRLQWLSKVADILEIKNSWWSSTFNVGHNQLINFNVIPFLNVRQIVFSNSNTRGVYSTRITYPPTWANIWKICDNMVKQDKKRAHVSLKIYVISEVHFDGQGTLFVESV